VKFLLDENLSPLHAGTLLALGHDAISVVGVPSAMNLIGVTIGVTMGVT
jgi:hypothetical protein